MYVQQLANIGEKAHIGILFTFVMPLYARFSQKSTQSHTILLFFCCFCSFVQNKVKILSGFVFVFCCFSVRNGAKKRFSEENRFLSLHIFIHEFFNSVFCHRSAASVFHHRLHASAFELLTVRLHLGFFFFYPVKLFLSQF